MIWVCHAHAERREEEGDQAVRFNFRPCRPCEQLNLRDSASRVARLVSSLASTELEGGWGLCIEPRLLGPLRVCLCDHPPSRASLTSRTSHRGRSGLPRGDGHLCGTSGSDSDQNAEPANSKGNVPGRKTSVVRKVCGWVLASTTANGTHVHRIVYLGDRRRIGHSLGVGAPVFPHNKCSELVGDYGAMKPIGWAEGNPIRFQRSPGLSCKAES
jgi:hypothetical protein